MATSPRIMMIHPPFGLSNATNFRLATGTPASDVSSSPPVAASPSASAAPTVSAAPTAMWNNQVIFRNPRMGGLFWYQPKPRNSFALPALISPTATPSDQTLFSDPQEVGSIYYLPAYALATTGSGNQAQLAVSLAVSSTGWLLTVKLDSDPLTSHAGQTAEIPATAYLLTTTLPDRTENWYFATAVVDGSSVTLSMPISDVTTFTAIYNAMTTPNLPTQLILRRSPQLALPVPASPPAPNQPAPQQLYRQSAVAIDTQIPFSFNKDANPYIFAGLPNIAGGTPSKLHRVSVPYPVGGAKSYTYWQDPLQPQQIYFLPDAFKIARLSTTPHIPAINIATSGSDPATLTVTLTFFALPVWDQNRIDAAAAGPLQSAFDISAITSLSILSSPTAQLLLNLPSSDPSTSNAPVPIANAAIDTANGFQGSVTLTLVQFQQVYNAMFVTPSILLSGLVSVTVDQDVEQVPFSGRASDFAGTILDTSLTYDATSNQATVVATNGIESPIHVAGLNAAILQGNTTISATLLSTAPALPTDLVAVQSTGAAQASPNGSAPGAGQSAVPATISAVSLTLQLASGQTLDPQTCVVQLDLSRVTVNPNSTMIWEAIVQHQAVAPVKKQLTLQLPAQVFGTADVSTTTTSVASATPATPASTTDPDATDAALATPSSVPAVSTSSSGQGSAPLLAVQVVFDNGQTVTFQPAMTAVGGLYTQTLGLNVDIAEFILGEGDSSNYTYRVDQITAVSTQQGDWITTNVDDLFLTLGD
jgi:hypothetical protein